MSYQVVVIQGNLGRDPETRYTPSGDAICNFSVAVSEKYKEQERTTWFRVTAFGKQAEICAKYLAKGSSVLVQGRIHDDKYTSKEGVEKTSWGLRADNVRFMGGKPDTKPEQKPDYKEAIAAGGSGFEDFEDDIPFYGN